MRELRRCFSSAILIMAVMLMPLTPAQADPDEEGGRDHPALSRMPNYFHYEANVEREFDAYGFFTGPETRKTVEGRAWQIFYRASEGSVPASNLQIQRNYAGAIEKLGGETVMPAQEGPEWSALLGTYRFNRDGAEVWVEVNTVFDGEEYMLRIVEAQAMKQDVMAGADAMLGELNRKGRALVYINFDTNQSTIRPESMPIVADVAAMLKENPALRIRVEGHTDNVGSAAANKALSEQRAASVKAALVNAGIDAGRITTAGFGQEEPIADNAAEEGRAKNRRVELVKR